MKHILLHIIDTLNLYCLFNRYTRDTGVILMLHRIMGDDATSGGGITPDILRRHFAYLCKHRYNVVSVREFVEALRNREDTFKMVVLTIDDGYRDFYRHGFPIFREFGFPASVFLVSDFIENRLFFWWDSIEFAINNTQRNQLNLQAIGLGTVSLESASGRSRALAAVTEYCKGLERDRSRKFIRSLIEKLGVDISRQPCDDYAPLTWAQIEEMRRHGIDFHPHSKTHPILSRVPAAEKLVEVSTPKSAIESRLGVEADIFCYPNGRREDFDNETIAALKSCGYMAAVTTIDGFDSTKEDADLFRLKRFGFPAEFMMFKQYVSGLERFKRIIGL